MKNQKHVFFKTISYCLAIACMVFILGSAVFASNGRYFHWSQSTEKKIEYIGWMSPRQVSVYFIATSPENGRFDVMLQRKGMFVIWYNTTHCGASQTSENRYDVRNHNMVQGQPNLLIWNIDRRAEYRIIMENPTKPQNTVISRFESWSSNHN